MPQHRSKGAGVASFIAVVKERLSAAELQRVEAALPEASKQLLHRRILAVEWIPIEDQAPIGKAMIAHVFAGDEEKYLAIVREASGRDLAGVYKLFMRVMSPQAIAKQASKIFATYVEHGAMSVVQKASEDGRVRFDLRVTEYCPLPESWLTLRGYIESPLMRSGAKNLTVRLTSNELTPAGANLVYEVTHDA